MFYRKDYEIGRNNEIQLLDTLKKRFSLTLELTNRFHTFDYYCEKNKIYIELKCRSNMKDKYESTMIGFNKIEKAILCSPEYCIYFVFQFKDGLFYWKFNMNELQSFEIKQGGRTDRGTAEISKYLFIPVKILKNI